MKIEGAYDVPAPRSKVWEAFLNPEQLRQAIPGCEALEPLGNDEFKATLKIGIAAVKGTFDGRVRITDQDPPTSYRLHAEGSGGPGFVRADTLITFSDIPGGTRVTYSADVQVGGLIAGVGQRMLGGVSKMMADQFFSRMGQLMQPQA
jgi:carbon monoxide dehydrogenase subunit G